MVWKFIFKKFRRWKGALNSLETLQPAFHIQTSRGEIRKSRCLKTDRSALRIRIKKRDSTFFADFLFGVLADREDCKSTMNTTFWPFFTFFAFFRRSPGMSDGFSTFFLPVASPSAPIEFILEISLTTGERGENLTWTDSFCRNRFCQTSSHAAPPLGHRKSGCTQ